MAFPLYLQHHQHKNTPSLFFPCTLEKLVAETNPCRLVMPQFLMEIDQLQQSCFQTTLSTCPLTALHTHQQNSHFSFPTHPSTKAQLWLHSYINHKFSHMVYRSLDLNTMRRCWVGHKYTLPSPPSISNLKQIHKDRSPVYSVLPSRSIQVTTAISSCTQILEVSTPVFLC